MAQRLFDKSGRDQIASGSVTTANTWKARLLSLNTTSNINKAVSGTAQLTGPIRLTITAHGWTVGDIIVTRGIGGTAGANGTYRIKTVVDANTVEIQTIAAQGETAQDTVGSGAYTSGGTALNLTRAAANSTFATDAPAAAGSSTDQTLAGVTSSNGQYTCTSPITWPSVAASTTVDAILFGNTTADRCVYFTDGKQLVRTTATAASSATSISVEPLYAGIPNSTALVFSNGVTATLTAVANAGDTSLTVSALSGAINKGHTTDAPITNANLPVTTASGAAGTFTYNVDATFGLFTI